MRRTDREITDRREIEVIIRNCQVCHLALATANGEPYAVALNFGYAPGNPPALYFHCAVEGKKLDIIRRNPRTGFIIDRPLELVTGDTACDWGMKYESVMGTGQIEIMEDANERSAGLDCIMRQYGNTSPTYRPETLQKTLVLKLTINEMTGKRRA